MGKRLLGGGIPDLRYMPAPIHGDWNDIVIEGARKIQGMPSFKKAGMTPEDSDAIHAYVIDQAWKAYEQERRAD